MAQRLFNLVEGLNVEVISPRNWNLLNAAWIVFFVVAGLLNIFVAYNFSEKTWGAFKTFGLMGITFVFLLGQTLWIANKTGAFAEEDAD